METATRIKLESEEKKRLRQEKIKKRIWEIDFIRGVCVILMICDHLLFDFWSFGEAWLPHLAEGSWLVKMYELTKWFFHLKGYWVTWAIVVCFFIMTSGISSNFSRSNFSRGLKLAGVAVFLTVGTYTLDRLFKTELIIRFGVIHCYAVSIIVCELWQRLTKLFPKWLNIALTLAISLPIIYFGVKWLMNPVYLDHNWFSIFGLTTRDFFSSDYFPLFPWLGVFLVGNLIGQFFYPKRKTLMPALNRNWCRPVKFMGRHALIIYVAHQVLFGGIFLLAGIILGYQ